MSEIPLGKKTLYIDQYDPTLLYPISRAPIRKQTGIASPLRFHGFDLWNCYEFSWLSESGKPELRILEWSVNCDSENIVESKSVKLYLNSFHNSKFADENEVYNLITKDLSAAVKSQIFIKIQTLDSLINHKLSAFTGINLDILDVNISDYALDKSLLKLDKNNLEVQETLYSNLLKANCLVTGQPDWGSIQISYKGLKIDHSSILKYLISFRNQNEFAEPAAERIFTDIIKICAPSELTIYIRFTRRGGIDINPIRSTKIINIDEVDNRRHVRQ
jgi:7-cyano-7-deazaguanine reductase